MSRPLSARKLTELRLRTERYAIIRERILDPLRDELHPDRARFGGRPTNHKRAEILFWRAVEAIWEEHDFYRHPWAELIVRTLIRGEHGNTLAIFGAKQSGKSTCIAAFSLVVWWAFSKERNGVLQSDASVTYRTTTVADAKGRGWGEIQRLFVAACSRTALPGHYYRTSPPQITLEKNSVDDKHTISCKTLANGGVSSHTHTKGQHTLVQIIVDDELNELPAGTERTGVALDAEFKFFRYIGIGNPTSWSDPLGLLATPADFDTVDLVEKMAAQWRTLTGTAIRLDARNSPNVIAGKIIFPHLPTQKTIDLTKTAAGGDDTFDFWQFIIAFPCPDGAADSVLSTGIVSQTRADSGVDLVDFTEGAALDPAYTNGGDSCVLQYFRWGTDAAGRWFWELLDHVAIEIQTWHERDVGHHIADEVSKLLAARNIAPNHFGIDSTGQGVVLGGVIERKLGRRIHMVDFRGKPTKRRLTALDPMVGDEFADRKISEAFGLLRNWVEAGQARGFCDDGIRQNHQVVVEATERLWQNKGSKRSIQPKRQTYNMNRSSDRLDAVAVASWILREFGFLPFGQQPVERNAAIEANRAGFTVMPSPTEIDRFRRVRRIGGQDDMDVWSR